MKPKKIKSIDRFQKEKYLDSLKQEEVKKLAYKWIDIKASFYLMTFYAFIFFIALCVVVGVGIHRENHKYDDIIERTLLISEEVCSAYGENYFMYHLENNNLIIII